MQSLLKDHLVKRVDGGQIFFSLTCIACGSEWRFEPVSSQGWKQIRFDARRSAAEEASKWGCICPFCGRAVCLDCFEDVEGIRLCAGCAQRLRERVDGEPGPERGGR